MTLLGKTKQIQSVLLHVQSNQVALSFAVALLSQADKHISGNRCENSFPHLYSSRHVGGHWWHTHGRRWHHVAWWGVPIGPIIIVVARVVSAVIAAVVTTVIVATVLVIAPPLRVVTSLTTASVAAVVT